MASSPYSKVWQRKVRYSPSAACLTYPLKLKRVNTIILFGHGGGWQKMGRQEENSDLCSGEGKKPKKSQKKSPQETFYVGKKNI